MYASRAARVHSASMDDRLLSLKCTINIKKYIPIERNLTSDCPCQIMEEDIGAIAAVLMGTSLHHDFSIYFFN